MEKAINPNNLKKPKVSILMNCYNSDAFLRQAIDSVYAQSFQDFEILFVDNCSIDKSAEIAKSYDERLRYIKTEQNISLYSARHYGLQFLRGDFLAVLDCDDYWKPDKLAYQIDLIDAKSKDFVYGAYDIEFLTKSSFQKIYYQIYRIYNKIKLKLKGNKDTSVSDQILNYDINLQTVLLRADKIGDLNFSPKLNLVGDYDFFIRFGIKNKSAFYYDNKIVSTTRMHPGQLSYRSFRNWYKEIRYLYLFVLKDKLSNNEKSKFKGMINFFKSSYLWEKGEFKKSLIIKKSFSGESFAYRFHWLKFKIIYWLK